MLKLNKFKLCAATHKRGARQELISFLFNLLIIDHTYENIFKKIQTFFEQLLH